MCKCDCVRRLRSSPHPLARCLHQPSIFLPHFLSIRLQLLMENLITESKLVLNSKSIIDEVISTLYTNTNLLLRLLQTLSPSCVWKVFGSRRNLVWTILSSNKESFYCMSRHNHFVLTAPCVTRSVNRQSRGAKAIFKKEGKWIVVSSLNLPLCLPHYCHLGAKKQRNSAFYPVPPLTDSS